MRVCQSANKYTIVGWVLVAVETELGVIMTNHLLVKNVLTNLVIVNQDTTKPKLQNLVKIL